jgi:hypothetical protein
LTIAVASKPAPANVAVVILKVLAEPLLGEDFLFFERAAQGCHRLFR